MKLEIRTDSQDGALCAYAREQAHGGCHQPPQLEVYGLAQARKERPNLGLQKRLDQLMGEVVAGGTMAKVGLSDLYPPDKQTLAQQRADYYDMDDLTARMRRP
jgi:hypothetical protein